MKRELKQTLPYILVIGGIIGFFASMMLTIETFEVLKDPSFVPNCNISPLISCGSIMSSEQSELFGFTNSLFGIAAYTSLATVGLAMLAGAKFKKWFWQGVQFGTTLGLIFVIWLIYESLYKINSLCPYCMTVWAVTIPIFWYTLLYNLDAGHIKPPKKLQTITNFARKYHGEILVTFYLIIIGLILNRFWYYWSTLL